MDVLELAVIGFRPRVESRRGVDELRRDHELIAGLAHAALEDMSDLELVADLVDRLCRALECKCRGARSHAQRSDLRELIHELTQSLLGETGCGMRGEVEWHAIRTMNNEF